MTMTTCSRWCWSETRVWASPTCSPGSLATSSASSPSPPSGSSSPLGAWMSIARSSRPRFGTPLAKKGAPSFLCFWVCNSCFYDLGISRFSKLLWVFGCLVAEKTWEKKRNSSLMSPGFCCFDVLILRTWIIMPIWKLLYQAWLSNGFSLFEF